MTKVGFKFEPCKKSYYVDTYELSENVKYRSTYIDKYFQYELRPFRWHSISGSRRNELIEKGEIAPNSGYKHEDDKGNNLDEHLTFQKECLLMKKSDDVEAR